MDRAEVNAIIEQVLKKMGLRGGTMRVEWKEGESDHCTLIIVDPDVGQRSISIAISSPETFEQEVTEKIQLAVRRVPYRGYEIKAHPDRLQSGEWSLNLHILVHGTDGVNAKKFTAVDTFPSEVDAIKQCFNFGKQIIDGEVENCSVDDL